MKILNKLILFSSLLSIVYASSINNFSHGINLTQQNVIKADVTGGYTIQDFCDYLQDKSEHYPLSDEFIERYQQTGGGYIDNAKKHGVPVDKPFMSQIKNGTFSYHGLKMDQLIQLKAPNQESTLVYYAQNYCFGFMRQWELILQK